mmetsp:Transcript_5575/g.8937  ORF Transcript_5575/g.8937 Transcript_5575/m.8937 type:complete len:359 (+) Transcript_5575:687-1763(+)
MRGLQARGGRRASTVPGDCTAREVCEALVGCGVLEASSVHGAFPATLVGQAPWDRLALWASQVHLDSRASTACRAGADSVALMAHRASRVCQVLRAPRAKRACRAGPAQQGLREIRVWRAAQVQRDHAVPRGRMARRVSLDLQVPAGQQVQLGQRDLLDCRVLSVQRARLERLVFRAGTLSGRLDFPESLASQEATARWASLVFLARVVLRECLASQEHRDLQGSTGLLAQHRMAQMPRWVCRSVVWEISSRLRTFGTEVAPPTRTTRQARKPACLQQAGATRLGRRLVPSRRPSTCAVPGVVTFSVTKIRRSATWQYASLGTHTSGWVCGGCQPAVASAACSDLLTPLQISMPTDNG